jgi:two-component system, LytTR family, response regulator
VTRRALIVDDERLARRELRAMLEEGHADTIRVVAEADSVSAAERQLRSTEADVVFLDVQLGSESGFDLLERLEPGVELIFVTAFDQYAVRAFEVNALDYLLKPFTAARLAQALMRLDQVAPQTQRPAPKLEPHDRLFLRLGDRMGFLPVSTIAAITADGDNSHVHTTDGRAHEIRKALREWEARLPEPTFVRVHRSAMVNTDHVERVEEWSHRSYLLYLRGVREPVTMSRRYAAHVRHRLG